MRIDDFVVTHDTPLIDIMKRLDLTAKGVVYVCDENHILKGVITDGDVRRSIINIGRLNLSAKDVMITNPIIIRKGEEDSAGVVMNKYFIRSVPIVDHGRLVDIRFIDDYTGLPIVKRRIEVPVVIMAGGKGVRLQPYTNILPKPLIPIGDKTITEHIVDRFVNSGCNKFEMIINYKKHLIKAYFKDNEIKSEIDFWEETEYLGTAGGLRMLIGKLNDSFFVTNCDVLIEADYSDILDYHLKSGSIATVVCAVKNMKLPYGVISTTKAGRITKIKEKPDISSIVNTGFYVLRPDFLERIPEGKPSQITDVLQECIDSGLRVGMYPVSEDSWMDMGQLDELAKMTERLEEIR